MIQTVTAHFSTLHRKLELVALYGLLMFFFGMALNHLFAPNVAGDLGMAYQETQEASAPPANAVESSDGGDRSLADLPMDQALARALARGEEEKLADSAVTVSGGDEGEGNIYDLVVRRGDTFQMLLAKAGINRQEASLVSDATAKVYDLKNLQVGQKMKVALDERGRRALELSSLRIDEPEFEVVISRKDDGTFIAKKEIKKLRRQLVSTSGVVEASLYQLAESLDVPAGVVAKAVSAYSYMVDFQRDIQKGAKFETLYEEYYDSQGSKVRDGDLVYAMLTVNDKEMKIYRFTTADGDTSYYNEDGVTVRRALLRTPVNAARMSSGFGMRRHPILGYSKMHKGVDFAASAGTPIYAAGDGVIEKLGRHGGYGNYVRIRHNREYATAYGHASRFARGMKVGRRVKQGQVIAYVGSTGRSTGPHLHFEVMRNGTQINPMKANVAPARAIERRDMARFRKVKNDIEALLASVPADGRVAMAR